MRKTQTKTKRSPSEILRDDALIDAAVKRAVRQELARQTALASVQLKGVKAKRRAKAA
jgi:hypothetical protein